jgi:pimeloyl-ACP methyl ester carboxylesterase
MPLVTERRKSHREPTAETPPTFVFVHGFLDDAAIWRPLIAALHTPESQSRPVDLAGMSGRPQEAGPYTLGRYASDVIDVIDGLSGPVVLVGHSIGTLIAELAAVERLDEVVALALDEAKIPIGALRAVHGPLPNHTALSRRCAADRTFCNSPPR